MLRYTSLRSDLSSFSFFDDGGTVLEDVEVDVLGEVEVEGGGGGGVSIQFWRRRSRIVEEGWTRCWALERPERL